MSMDMRYQNIIWMNTPVSNRHTQEANDFENMIFDILSVWYIRSCIKKMTQKPKDQEAQKDSFHIFDIVGYSYSIIKEFDKCPTQIHIKCHNSTRWDSYSIINPSMVHVRHSPVMTPCHDMPSNHVPSSPFLLEPIIMPQY